MATWTDVANMLLDVDDPARSVDIKAIEENIRALAEGATGAPKIQPAALDPSIAVIAPGTAGTTVTQKFMGTVFSTATDIFTSMGGQEDATAVFTAFVDSVVTVQFDYDNTQGSSGNASVTATGSATGSVNIPASTGTGTLQFNVTMSKGDSFGLLVSPSTGGVVRITDSNVKTANNVVCGG